jgi:quinol monooxygenase YgiN
VYVRILKLDIQPADLRTVQDFYRQKVLPMLQQHSSCRFASLLQATSNAEECISLTLWDDPEEAEGYEQSQAYSTLLEEGTKLISDTPESSVRRAEDGLRQAGDTKQAITGDAFTIEAGDSDLPDSDLPSRLYLRIVSVRVQPGKWDELIELYNGAVLPTLRSTQGSLATFLVEALHDPDLALSISLWSREEDAIRYEMSGTFDGLTRKLKDTLEGSTQWKVSVGPVGSASNPPARGYKQVVGEKFRTAP